MSELVTVITQQSPLAVNIQNTDLVTYLQPSQKIVNLSGGPVVAAGGSSADYAYQQTTAATIWTVAHNLGRKPPITVTDHLGSEILADVAYIDDNIIQVTHGVAITGFVFL